ncbi:MAG: hypothetical protein IID30_15265, partial [Planctomycetes bacterium]|nr:hypothetical protein [Planctomycetota bacterium]
RVRQLHAIEREMLLGRLRMDALMRLGELTAEVPAASADEIRAAEVMRKACVDLLRYGGSNTENRHSQQGEPRGGGPRSRRYHRESITPASEAEVLEALERLGEEREEYPQITQMGLGESKSGNDNGYEPYEPRARASGSVEPMPPKVTPPPEMTTPSPSDMPSEAPPESHLSIDSISLNGPGACASGSLLGGPGVSGGRASGSYSQPARDPLHQPRPPPHNALLPTH